MFVHNINLNRRMIGIFLFVALLPLMLFGFTVLRSFENAIGSNRLDDLIGMLEQKQEILKRWFKDKENDIEFFSKLRETVRTMDAFSRAVATSGYEGAEYHQAVDQYAPSLALYGSVYGYADLLLIARDGRVVYSNAKASDYMTNLLHGPYAGTDLGAAFKKSLRGETHLTDLHHYAPASAQPVMFLTAPVEVGNEIAGVAALRISGESLSELMAETRGMGETGEIIVVGRDFLMRSESRFDNEEKTNVLRTRVDTRTVRQAFSGIPFRGRSTDYRNEKVFAVSDQLNIQGVNWMILAKIDEQEALAALADVQNFVFFLSGVILLIAMAMAWFFAKSLSRPIAELTEMARRVADGDLSRSIHSERGDEIGDLGRSFNMVVETQRQIGAVMASMARGDLNVRVVEKSEEDVLARSINQMIAVLKKTAQQAKAVAGGDYSTKPERISEKDELGMAIQDMHEALRKNKEEIERRDWLQRGLARLNDTALGEMNLAALTSRIIAEIATWLDAKVGAFYVLDEEKNPPLLKLTGSYAYTQRKNLSNTYALGEGLVGQAALEKQQILMRNVPEDYIRVVSGLGESVPRNIYVTPVMYKTDVQGVIEIATLFPMSDDHVEYLRQSVIIIGIVLRMAQAREWESRALGNARQLAEELKAQQEVLQNANNELEEQAARLRESELALQVQQGELETSNAEFEEQTARLEESEQKLQSQQRELEMANDGLTLTNELLERQKAEVEKARKDIAEKAEEVALASKYKSEFLANMSHELRTPLNSLLLLARSLRDNNDGNLSEEQVQSAEVIFESGSDLLNLINEILDLSKIEAGRMELHPEHIELKELERTTLSQFEHMATAKGLYLRTDIEADAPASIVSDPQRLGQVLKNLIGNAIKFTETGGVSVVFARPSPESCFSRSDLRPEQTLAIHVKDTGMGIPPEKRKLIFEAFQQADSGDRRSFGGTGLGLTISREITALLDGEIHLESELERGSVFSIYIPLHIGESGARMVRKTRPNAEIDAQPMAASDEAPPEASAATSAPTVGDDRESIGETDSVVLVIEGDRRFGKSLAGVIRERGFKCIVAGTGEEGLQLAKEHKPLGIILDIQLPGMNGWAVLNTLKQEISLRHIPVHIVSAEETGAHDLRVGAVGYAVKPIDREQIMRVLERLEAASAEAPKRVLLVEDDDAMRKNIVRIIGNGNVTVEEVTTGKDAIQALGSRTFDLAIVDLGLPDMQGLDLLEHITKESISLPPVIIHTARELTMEEEIYLRNYADSFIIKDVRSEERLIDEVALFLHRVVHDLPEANKRAILHLRESDEPLQGKKVLIVEDDMRTMFAMARLLAGHGVNPLKAEQGQRALEILEEQPDVDLVLMDIMMPIMDGYEAMRKIRSQERFAKLPIVALTAKAMKEDRQKCFQAGATDYLSKPVDPDRLVSLMRVLLCR